MIYVNTYREIAIITIDNQFKGIGIHNTYIMSSSKIFDTIQYLRHLSPQIFFLYAYQIQVYEIKCTYYYLI